MSERSLPPDPGGKLNVGRSQTHITSFDRPHHHHQQQHSETSFNLPYELTYQILRQLPKKTLLQTLYVNKQFSQISEQILYETPLEAHDSSTKVVSFLNCLQKRVRSGRVVAVRKLTLPFAFMRWTVMDASLTGDGELSPGMRRLMDMMNDYAQREESEHRGGELENGTEEGSSVAGGSGIVDPFRNNTVLATENVTTMMAGLNIPEYDEEIFAEHFSDSGNGEDGADIINEEDNESDDVDGEQADEDEDEDDDGSNNPQTAERLDQLSREAILEVHTIYVIEKMLKIIGRDLKEFTPMLGCLLPIIFRYAPNLMVMSLSDIGIVPRGVPTLPARASITQGIAGENNGEGSSDNGLMVSTAMKSPSAVYDMIQKQLQHGGHGWRYVKALSLWHDTERFLLYFPGIISLRTITELSLQFSHITDTDLTTLVTDMPLLKKLFFVLCSNVTTYGIISCFSRLERLESFRVDEVQGVDMNVVLNFFIDNPKLLKSVNLQNMRCYSITRSKGLSLFKELKHLHFLLKISNSGTLNPVDETTMNDTDGLTSPTQLTVWNSLATLSKLTSLSLDGTHMPRVPFCELVNSIPTLEALSVSTCSLESSGFVNRPNSINLKVLYMDDVYGVTDNVLNFIATNCNKLEEWDVTHIHGSYSLHGLANCIPKLHSLKALAFNTNLAVVESGDHLSTGTYDDVFKAVCSIASNLQTLGIHFLFNFDSRRPESITAKDHTHTMLTQFKRHFQSNTISTMFSKLGNLRFLHLSTILVPESLVRANDDLNITPADMKIGGFETLSSFIAAYCHKLQCLELALDSRESPSLKVLKPVLENCPHLERLSVLEWIYGQLRIDDEEMEAFDSDGTFVKDYARLAAGVHERKHFVYFHPGRSSHNHGGNSEFVPW